MTRSLLLILTANERVVFSERAATEGAHRTLGHPPGAALLGWAAGAASYEAFDDSFAVFHSGRVRFSNALPIAPSGRVAYPMPQLLMRPKHGHRGTIENVGAETLDASVVTIGRPEGKPDASGRPVQRDVFDRSAFVTRAGEVVRPALGSRLRTAVRQGRAAKGQLFGYTHVEPAGEPRYAATIEADDISDNDWDRLRDVFTAKRPLRLGRAARTSYGGAYQCDVMERDSTGVWPEGGATGLSTLRVWALSDLALVDRRGAPCYAPTPDMFGLPAGKLLATGSAIGMRRHAPWNRRLDCRDIERQTIAAGSVLTFALDAPIVAQDMRHRVGLWQEAGLGRVWINPPLLAGSAGTPPRLDVDGVALAPTHGATTEPTAPVASDPLVAWLSAMPSTGRAA